MTEPLDLTGNYTGGDYVYKMGGNGFTSVNGKKQVDCSHMVNLLLKGAGYNIPYEDTRVMANSTYYTAVLPQDVKRGDIALWINATPNSSGSPLFHTGIVEDFNLATNSGHIFGAQTSTGPAKAVFGPKPPSYFWPVATKFLRAKEEFRASATSAVTPVSAAASEGSAPQVNFQFPVRKADGSHYQLEELYKELEKETSGHYLLGNHGFWHGGIHFSEKSIPHCKSKQPVRCIADGEVIAYRLNKDYLTSTFQGETECSNLQYSTSFCLVRHTYESAKRTPEKQEKSKIDWSGRTVRLVSSRNARDVAGTTLGKSGNFEAMIPADTELQIISLQDALVDGYRFVNAKITKGQLNGKDRAGKPVTRSVGHDIWFAAFDKNGEIIKGHDKREILQDTTPPPAIKAQPAAVVPESNTLSFFSLYMHLLPYEQFPLKDSASKRRVKVNATGLNVRKEANLTATTLGHIDTGAELEVISTTAQYRKQPGDTTTYELAQVKILSKGVKHAGKQTAKVGDTVWLALSKTETGKAVERYTQDLPRSQLARPAYWKGKVKARLKKRLPAFKNQQDDDSKCIGQIAENSVLEYHTDTLQRVIRNGQPHIMAACSIISGGLWDKPYCPAGPVWITIDANSLELTPEAPTDFDSVIKCMIPIKAGDPISYLGLYETPASVKGGKTGRHQVHIETFTTDPHLEAFLKNPAGLKEGRQYLRAAKGKVIYSNTGTDKEPKFTASGHLLDENYLAEQSLTKLVKGPDNKSWYQISVDIMNKPINGYIAKPDAEIICQHDWEKLGFQIIKETDTNADGFLDPEMTPDFFKTLYKQIDQLGNKDGNVTPDEIALALKNPKLRDRWSKLIAYHPTEWQATSDQPKWQRLKELLKDSPNLLAHEQERIDKLVFWDEMAGAMQIELPKQIYHFHPLGLIDSLSMNTGEVADSELMYLARTIYGEARGQNYISKIAVGWIIRNRLAKGTWGSTYRSVVTARLQFTCWSEKHDPHGYKAIHNPVGQAWEDCQKAAEEVMSTAASANVLPEALNYYSPRAQAQLHIQKPSVYPETPSFAISTKRVPNPSGVSDDDYRFYKG